MIRDTDGVEVSDPNDTLARASERYACFNYLQDDIACSAAPDNGTHRRGKS